MGPCLLLGLMFGQFVESDDFTKAQQERAAAATVRIVNRTRRSEGSGVLIGRKDKAVYILSAAHLLQRGERLEIATFTTASYPEPAKVYTQAEVVARTKDIRDLVLLRLTVDDPPPAILPLCPTRLLPKGKKFTALSAGCGVAAAPVCLIETVKDARSLRRGDKTKTALFWETVSPQTPGRSGGPLIDRQGRVIGVASGVNRGKGYYSHASEIHRWLKANKLDFLIDEKETSTQK